jgi:hypothetical protein
MMGGKLAIVNSTSNGIINIEESDSGMGMSSVGGLVAVSTAEQVVIDGAESNVDISVDSACSMGCYVGGLVGTSGGFMGDGSGFGGIVGIYDSKSHGDIDVNAGTFAFVGGSNGLFFNDAAVIDGYERTGSITTSNGLVLVGGLSGASYAADTSVYGAEIKGSIDIASGTINPEDIVGSTSFFMPLPVGDFSIGVGGGLMGAMASASADIEKSYVSGNVSSPFVAGGMVGATVGVDVNFDAIFGAIMGQDVGAINGMSDMIRPGKVTAKNTYVSGNVTSKATTLLVPPVPPMPIPGGESIEFPENPEITFGGIAGGIFGIGVNASIINSYASGNITAETGGLNFDINALYEQAIDSAPDGVVSPELAETFEKLLEIGNSTIKGVSGGLSGVYLDRAPSGNDDPGYKIENSFAVGRVQSAGYKGALFGLAPDYQFDYYSNANGAFEQPKDIAHDSQGNLYVLDAGNYRVQKFNSDGEFMFAWGSEGNNPGEFSDYTTALEIDQNDNVYIVDNFYDKVQKFNSDGEFVSLIANNETGDGVLNQPSDIAFGPDGSIYISDYVVWTDPVIKKYDSNGAYISNWSGASTTAGKFESSPTITVGLSGEVYTYDEYNRTIAKFSGGTLQSQWSLPTPDGDLGPLSTNSGSKLYIDSANKIYVAENLYGLVYQFNDSGSLLNTWDLSGFSTITTGIPFISGPSSPVKPYAFTSTQDGGLYALDTGKTTIYKIDSDGVYQGSLGRRMVLGGMEEVEFTMTGSPEVTNNYFDKTRTTLENCGTILDLSLAVVVDQDVSLEQSINDTLIGNEDCHGANQGDAQPGYFKDNHVNAPLNQWNFDTIWRTNVDGYPTFVGTYGVNHEINNNVPKVSTNSASGITPNTAIAGGSTSPVGITSRGIQYGTTSGYGNTAQDIGTLQLQHSTSWGQLTQNENNFW